MTLASTGQLRWGVRESFTRYVLVIARGTCDADNGASVDADGVVEFPLGSVDAAGTGERFSFTGGVRFSAHHGFLDVDLRDIEVEVEAAGGGALSIAHAEGRAVIATLGQAVATEVDGCRRLTIPAWLTARGVEVFGSVYAEGTEMADLDIAVRTSQSG